MEICSGFQGLLPVARPESGKVQDDERGKMCIVK